MRRQSDIWRAYNIREYTQHVPSPDPAGSCPVHADSHHTQRHNGSSNDQIIFVPVFVVPLQ
jgi:hypothetical protein